MKKKLIRFTAAVLSGTVIISAAALPGGAVSFGNTDSNTAVAGASASLKNYLEDGRGTAQDIAAALAQVRAAYEVQTTAPEEPDAAVPETIAAETEAPKEAFSDEVIYDQPRTGVANVQGVLNVRKDKTTLSDIVEYAVRGAEIEVTGEVVSNNVKWYKVNVNGTEGYVAGNLVVFGDDADKMRQLIEEEETEMPQAFEVYEDLDGVDPDIKDRIEGLAHEVSFVMRVDYPEYFENEEYTNTYSVLIYMIELLSQIGDLANENGLTSLYERVDNTIGIVEANRQKLSDMTGYSDDDFVSMIRDAQKRADEEQLAAELAAAEAEAQRIAAERAEQEAQAAAAAAAAAQAALAQQQADEEARRRAEAEAQAAQAAADAAANDAAAQQRAAEQAAIDQARAEAAAREAADAAAQAEAAAKAAEEERQRAMEIAAQEAAASGTGRAIADFAASWVGRINYVWGGNDFREGGGVDCSHFTYNVYRNFGLASYYAYSGDQRGWGTPVAIENIQPGDLVCYDGHVAIYYGNNMIVHAPAPGRMIEFGNLYLAPIRAVRRMY